MEGSARHIPALWTEGTRSATSPVRPKGRAIASSSHRIIVCAPLLCARPILSSRLAEPCPNVLQRRFPRGKQVEGGDRPKAWRESGAQTEDGTIASWETALPYARRPPLPLSPHTHTHTHSHTFALPLKEGNAKATQKQVKQAAQRQQNTVKYMVFGRFAFPGCAKTL